MDTPQERLEYFIGKYYHNKTDFARGIGVSLANLNKYLGKEASILGPTYYSKMIELNLNPTWYTTGQGNMLFNDIKNNVMPLQLSVEKIKSSLYQLSPEAREELDNLLNIKIYLTPSATMGYNYAFNDIPITTTTFRDYMAPNSKNIAGIIARGDSMENLIREDSIVFFEKGSLPKNNQIIVAQFRDSCVIKRFVKKDDGTIWLYSENKKYEPVKIEEDDVFVIIGVCNGGYNRF